MSRKITIIVTCLVALIVGLVVVVVVNIQSDGDNHTTTFAISAKEGQFIADNVSHQWRSNAILTNIRLATTDMTPDRLYIAWYYLYYSINSSEMTLLDIKVYSNGSYEAEEIGPGLIDNNQKPLLNWTIDITEAYSIALENEKITSFMKYNPALYSLFLSSDSGQTVWYFEWTYDEGGDDPNWAEIQIDANTGEVLYVKAPD